MREPDRTPEVEGFRSVFQDVGVDAFCSSIDKQFFGALDQLTGLKENIIIGHLIPAGTGAHRYQSVEFMVEQSFYDEEIIPLGEPGELVAGLGVGEESD